MTQLAIDHTIMVALEPIDMRKSINGLCIAVSELLQLNPQCQQVFIFRNKALDKVKILYWDKNGFCMLYKRLEKHKFKIPKYSKDKTMTIDAKQFSWLFAGFDFVRMSERTDLDFTNYS